VELPWFWVTVLSSIQCIHAVDWVTIKGIRCVKKIAPFKVLFQSNSLKKIQQQPANPGSSGKWSLNWVKVYSMIYDQ